MSMVKTGPFDFILEAIGRLALSSCCRNNRRGPLRSRLESIRSTADAVWLLQSVSAQCATTDKICALIVSSYRNSPPSELEMRRLSLLYQATEGGADIEAFATLTLWLCAIESFCSPFTPAPKVVGHRTKSFDAGTLTAVSSMTRLMEMSDGHDRYGVHRNRTMPSRLDDLSLEPTGGWNRTHLLDYP